MKLHLHQTLSAAVVPTGNVLRAAAMFGLGLDHAPPVTLIPPITLDLPLAKPAPPGGRDPLNASGALIFITGPSGGGKTTLLRLIKDALQPAPERAPSLSPHEGPNHSQSASPLAADCDPRAPIVLIDLAALPPLPEVPLVDCFALPLDAALAVLSQAGLADALLVLRRPGELSAGQRERLRLAHAMALVRAAPRETPIVILADEFAATLDRITAFAIARNVRRWTRRTTNLTVIAAAGHDDLIEPLDPDLVIEKDLGPAIAIAGRSPDPSHHHAHRRHSSRRRHDG